MLKKKSLVVFNNRDVIVHETHNKAIEEYAKKHGVDKKEAFTEKHILSMLVLIEHDIAEVIVHFGLEEECIKILDEVGISLR